MTLLAVWWVTSGPMLWGLTQTVSPLHPWEVRVMCSEHLEMWEGLFKWDVRDVGQDLIPYVGQLKCPYVPIEGWIIAPDMHSLLDGPCNGVKIPTHNGEVVHPGMMTCHVSIVIDGKGDPRSSLNFSIKGPTDSPILSQLYLCIPPPLFCVMLSLSIRQLGGFW